MNNSKESIIIFQHDENWAKKKIYGFIKKKVFRTKEYRENVTVTNIKKVYIPFQYFTVNSNLHAFLDYYNDSSENRTAGYFEKIIDFKMKILGKASSTVDDTLISNIMPYSLNKRKPLVENEVTCDVLPISSSDEEIRKKMEYNVRKNMIQAAKGHFPHDYHVTSASKIDLEYLETILLPVWIIEVKTNESIHTYYINDQTGKTAGNVDFYEVHDKWLLVKICLALAILVLLCNIVALMCGGEFVIYVVGVVFLILIFAFLYDVFTKKYHQSYQFIQATILKKKYLKNKTYALNSTYQKALEQFKLENEID